MLVLLGVLSLGAFPESDAVVHERGKLEGSWRIVGIEIEGRKVAPEELPVLKLSFKGQTFASTSGEEKRMAGSYRVDMAAKPRRLEFAVEEGLEKGAKRLMLYQLDGDTLRVFGSESGKEAPTEFNPKDKTGLILLTYKREK